LAEAVAEAVITITAVLEEAVFTLVVMVIQVMAEVVEVDI
jgi:hypothetical protein